MSSIFILIAIITLIIGLIKPSVVIFWVKKPTLGKFLLYWTPVAIACFWGLVITLPKSEFQNESDVQLIDSSNVEVLVKEPTLTEKLEKEIAGIDTLKLDVFRGSVQSVNMEVALFNVWKAMIKEGLSSDTTSQLANKLKKRVVSIQAKEFPALRAEYGKALDEVLWEHNIDVSVSGSKKDIITFTGGAFAANKNIKSFQEQLWQNLHDLRFKQVRWKWYKGQDDYQYNKLETERDNHVL